MKRSTNDKLIIASILAISILATIFTATLSSGVFYAALLFLFPVIANSSLLIIIFLRKYRTTAILWFVFFLSALIGWSISDYITTVTRSATVYSFWIAFASLGYAFLPALLVMFTRTYAGKDSDKPGSLLPLLYFIPALIFLMLEWNTETIVVKNFASATLSPWGYDAPTGTLFPLFLLWFESMTIYSLYVLYRFKRTLNDPIKKKQLNLFMIAILIPLIGGTITNGILPILKISVFPTAVPLTTVMSILIGISIIKYGLFSFRPSEIASKIVATMAEAMLVIDRDLKIQLANDRVLQVLGATSARVIDQPISRFIKDKERLKSLIDNAIIGNETGLSGEIVGAPNTIKPVLMYISKILDTSGEIEGYILVLTDLSEDRKKAVELQGAVSRSNKLNTELENTKSAMINLLEDIESEKAAAQIDQAKSEAIVSSIGEGMIAVDENAQIVLVNGSAQILTGYKDSELLGKDFYKNLLLFDREEKIINRKNRPMDEVLTHGQKVTTGVADEIYISRKDKSRFPAAITVAPIKGDKKPVGAVMVFRDISKETEVDRQKTEFISLASHQLRTPLSAIKWFSEMLMEGDAGKLTKDQKQFMNNVVVSTNRMIELVNTLLNISRIESGRISIVPRPTNLEALIKELITQLEPSIIGKKIKITLKIDPNLPKINVDPQLLREAYSNILTNAAKYTPPSGAIAISISLSGDSIISSVSDNGYGIPKKEFDRVFTKFYRGGNIVQRETSGTGLGLYLTKAIIESSSGEIWFESVENKGTTFYIKLPLSGARPHKGKVSINL